MKILATLAAAGVAALALAGTAEAMPVAPAGSSAAPLIHVDMVVTKTVRRGPLGGAVVTKRVVRRPMMGRTVTTTRVVR